IETAAHRRRRADLRRDGHGLGIDGSQRGRAALDRLCAQRPDDSGNARARRRIEKFERRGDRRMSPVAYAVGASVRIGTPLLLAGLGELVLERAGMINIGIEGVMLCGAFGGFYAGWATQSPLLGAVVGALTGAAFMLIFAVMTLKIRAD